MVAVFGLMLVSFKLPHGPNFLLPFVMALFAFVVFSAVNTDGGLVVHYPAFSGDPTVTSPVWPTQYLTLFGIVLNLATAAYHGTR